MRECILPLVKRTLGHAAIDIIHLIVITEAKITFFFRLSSSDLCSALLSEVLCEGRHLFEVVVVAGRLLTLEGPLHVLNSPPN